jgi:hypothetical protein
MPEETDDQEFDFASFIQSPMAFIMTAVGAADTAKKTLVSLVEAVQSLQRSAAAMESILQRVDTMVGQIEAPAKVLGPEMERLAQRMVAMSDLFDRTPIDQLPELFENLSAQMMSVLSGMAELPRRLGPLGDLFGGAAGLMGLGRSTTESALKAVVAKAAPQKAVPKGAASKKAAPKKAAPKKAVPKKVAAKRLATKQVTKKASTKRK